MLGRHRSNRIAVERVRKRLAKKDKALHLGDARVRLARFHPHLLALPELVDQEDCRQDEESGNELKTTAMVDFTGAIEKSPQLTGGNDPHGNREAADEEDVVASEYSHREAGFLGLPCLSVFGGIPLGRIAKTLRPVAAQTRADAFARLFEATGHPDYRSWAQASLSWLDARLLDPSTGLYRYGIRHWDMPGQGGEYVDPRLFSYDQGIMIEVHLAFHRSIQPNGY